MGTSSIPLCHSATLPFSSHRLHPYSPSSHLLLLPKSLHTSHNLPPPGPILLNNRHATLHLTETFFGSETAIPPLALLSPCLAACAATPLHVTPRSSEKAQKVVVATLFPHVDAEAAASLAGLVKEALQGRDALSGDVVPVAAGVVVVVVVGDYGVVGKSTQVGVDLSERGKGDVQDVIRMNMRARWMPVSFWWYREAVRRLDWCVRNSVGIVLLKGLRGDVEEVLRVYACGAAAYLVDGNEGGSEERGIMCVNGWEGVGEKVRRGILERAESECVIVMGEVGRDVLERVEVEVVVEEADEAEREEILGEVGEEVVKMCAGMARKEIEGVGEVYEEAGVEDVKESLRILGRSLKVETGGVKWEDVGGLEDAKGELRALVGGERGGVLLYGPPGGGKTLLARALASEGGCSFIAVKGPEVLDMYVGESERRVREIFERAIKCAPCVVFLDELDALTPRRGGGEGGGVMDRVVSQVVGMLDDVKGKNVFVVAATNRPDLVDGGVLRAGRLERLVYVGVPEREEQEGILRAICREFEMEEIDWERVLKGVGRVTGADLYKIAAEAWIRAAKRVEIVKEGCWVTDGLQEAAEWITGRHWWGEVGTELKVREGMRVKVLEEDFVEAAKAVKPSLSERELQEYELLRIRLETGV